MKRRNLAIHFETEHLNRLILDESSCVILKHCTHHLALHPYHLTSLSESLKTILSKGIAKYDKTLGGILLGYQNIKLLSSVGALNNDACFIHVDISADFFLFKPDVGTTLTGVVNKKSEDHVGCLVHNAFNVSLPKPQDEEDWIGSMVQIGQEILFQINRIDLEGRLPYIRATFISLLSEVDSGISTGEEMPSKKRTKKKLKGTKLIFKDETEDAEMEEPEVKKKKKKRKSPEEHYPYEETCTPSTSQKADDMNITYSENKKKHKKRKKTLTDDYSIETNYEDMKVSMSSSFYDGTPNLNELKKIKKKIKQEISYGFEDSEYNIDTIKQEKSPKLKKKHKTKNSY